MRWLYHVLRADQPRSDPYAPASLVREGFIHASFQPAVAESARLYFPAGVPLVVLQIDPRELGVAVELAETPRGPMPHIRGPIPAAAIRAVRMLAELEDAPDVIER